MRGSRRVPAIAAVCQTILAASERVWGSFGSLAPSIPFIADYVTSEAGVALLLDQHVNRPGHVPKTMAQAVDRLAYKHGATDPTGWSDVEERELLQEYVVLRSGTSMTDSDKRAQVVLNPVSRGVIAERRGAFVLSMALAYDSEGRDDQKSSRSKGGEMGGEPQ